MVSRLYARLLGLPAAALAIILSVGTAFAATTWTVRPGGPVSLKSGKFTLKDTRTGASLTCTSSGMSGTLKSGSGLPGSGIGSITKADVGRCSGPMVFTITMSGLPWGVSFSSYQSSTGVVTGSISHVHLKMKPQAEICQAVVDGTSGSADDGVVTFNYTNSTGKLTLLSTGGDLHFYDARDCAGLIENGDSATLSATYTVSPKQTITSS